MKRRNKINVKALCLCSYQNKILVFKGFDHYNKRHFYRPAGGGIEFGENGEDTIKREFQEELGLHITDIKYITTIEAIFTYNGEKGHHIILLYDGTIVEKEVYNTELQLIEDDENQTCFPAFWKSFPEIEQEKIPLYPEKLKAILMSRIEGKNDEYEFTIN